MSHVLALQALEPYSAERTMLDSGGSGTCSDASGAGGHSGCSIGCDELAEMDW